jgi:hypothetical protein
VLGIELGRVAQGAHSDVGQLHALQQVKKATTSRIVVVFDLELLDADNQLMSTDQHGAKWGHHVVGNIVHASDIVIIRFR